MRKINMKLIPGDGIGIDVVREGSKVLKTLEELHGGIRFELDQMDWGCEYYLRTNKMMPDDGLKILADSDAILLGAIGFPGVPDHISLRELLLPIRQQFDQYINLRPVKLLEGLRSPLALEDHQKIDFVVIRENTEGEYCGIGHMEHEGTPLETAVQVARFTRRGTARVIRYAFEYARKNGLKRFISATKSNALNVSMVFWDRIFKETCPDYPEIEARSIHIDALAGLFITHPEKIDIVVASNLFGDILTDLGSAMLGSIGISPSANLNPERTFPSMFEPVHGSAPDIAGKGIANPIGMIWSIVLMLEHLELNETARFLMKAMTAVIKEGRKKTPDMGGRSKTEEVVAEIIGKLRALS
ncbi:MAG: tartrate dehydrogenase [Pseudomonadota bacterium]